MGTHIITVIEAILKMYLKVISFFFLIHNVFSDGNNEIYKYFKKV